jgi:uracil phosphoribosyltransferase
LSNLYVCDHPLVKHKLTLMRQKTTPAGMFRELVNEITQLLVHAATADLPLKEISGETPLAPFDGEQLVDRVGLVPILRAGLGMVQPALALIPNARVLHIGLFRNEETLQPVYYYDKLPSPPTVDIALVVDPMLATGGSVRAAIARLKETGIKRIRFIGMIAAPEGVEALHAEHPDVDIHLAGLDSHLDENGYIVPGLGDAGDRQFMT